jgi:hypothetical protein
MLALFLVSVFHLSGLMTVKGLTVEMFRRVLELRQALWWLLGLGTGRPELEALC